MVCHQATYSRAAVRRQRRQPRPGWAGLPPDWVAPVSGPLGSQKPRSSSLRVAPCRHRSKQRKRSAVVAGTGERGAWFGWLCCRRGGLLSGQGSAPQHQASAEEIVSAVPGVAPYALPAVVLDRPAPHAGVSPVPFAYVGAVLGPIWQHLHDGVPRHTALRRDVPDEGLQARSTAWPAPRPCPARWSARCRSPVGRCGDVAGALVRGWWPGRLVCWDESP